MHVLVIGGGPAGVTAALHAVGLGAEVTLVERGRIGGTTLNSGPAPVRTLARAARLVRDWSSWETFGLRGPRPEVDVAAALANAERVASYAHDRRRITDRVRACGVDVVEQAGDVRFLDADTVAAADGRTWTADRVIIAVGGRPSRLPIPGAELGLTFEDVRNLTVAARAGLRRRSRRHRLPARLDPGRLRLPRHAAGTRHPDRATRRRGRLGRARAGVPGPRHRRRHRRRRPGARATPTGVRVGYRSGDETEHRRRRRRRSSPSAGPATPISSTLPRPA